MFLLVMILTSKITQYLIKEHTFKSLFKFCSKDMQMSESYVTSQNLFNSISNSMSKVTNIIKNKAF